MKRLTGRKLSCFLSAGRKLSCFLIRPASTPQPSWLEAIAFGPPDAPRAATVFANLGLSSCRSPLPDYLRRLTLDPDVRDPLGELLSLLDDRLLERRFASYRPEGDRGIFPDWAGTKRDMLCLGALRSPAALHWLFQAIYPELRVTVLRAPQDHSMPAPDARLGTAALGMAALSGRAVVPVRALEVRIACQDDLSPTRLSSAESDASPRRAMGSTCIARCASQRMTIRGARGSCGPAKEADKIDKLRGALDTTIADVVREAREAQGTLADKNAAIATYDTAFSRASKVLEGIFTLAGETALADRVIRPSTRRPGQTEEQAPPAEPGAAGEPGDK